MKETYLYAIPVVSPSPLAKKETSGKFEIAGGTAAFVYGIGYVPYQLILCSEFTDIIPVGEWYVDDTNQIRKSVTSDKEYWAVRKEYKKIIASYPQIVGTTPIDELDVQYLIDAGMPEKVSLQYKQEYLNSGKWLSVPEVAYFKGMKTRDVPKLSTTGCVVIARELKVIGISGGLPKNNGDGTFSTTPLSLVYEGQPSSLAISSEKEIEYIKQGLIEIGNCKNMEEAQQVVDGMGLDKVVLDKVSAAQLYGDGLWAAIYAIKDKQLSAPEDISWKECAKKLYQALCIAEPKDNEGEHQDIRDARILYAQCVHEIQKQPSVSQPFTKPIEATMGCESFSYCKAEIEGGKICTEQCDHCKEYYAPLEKPSVPEDYEAITGHKTPELRAAYEEGRDAEQRVIIDWITNWKGGRNSAMGELLHKKMNELYNTPQPSVSEALSRAQYIRKQAIAVFELTKGFDVNPTDNAMKSLLEMCNYILELTNEPQPTTVDMSKISRVEVIDHSDEHMKKCQGARAWQKHNCKSVELSYQDDNKTLKVFVK